MINTESLFCASLLLLFSISVPVFAKTAKKSAHSSTHRHSSQRHHYHHHNNDNDGSIIERVIYTGISIECLAWAIGGLSYAFGCHKTGGPMAAYNNSNYGVPLKKLIEYHALAFNKAKEHVTLKNASITAAVIGSYLAYSKSRKFYKKACHK